MISLSSWKPADNLSLEPNALVAAKEINSSLALTAGPGAGKTEMLAQRADFLLRTGVCRYPKRILAISFKVDASKNLKDRVTKRCGVSYASRLDSHTFHAFAKRIIDRFRKVLTGADALDADYKIGSQRINRKQITFDELVPLSIEIIKRSKIARKAIQETYSDVFLDEFQDCTNTQYELIRILFKGTAVRLTAVGDTKQRIMGWAGALEGIFVTFASDFGARGLNLYRNFRSMPKLIRLQNEIVRTLDPSGAQTDEQLKGSGGEILLFEFANSQLEAVGIAEMISTLIDEQNVPEHEIAILASKQADLYTELLAKELESRGIPVRNEQKLQDIANEPVTRLIVDYLSIIYGNREPEAYTRLFDLLLASGYDDEEQSRLYEDWQRYLQIERAAVFISRKSKQSLDIVWEIVRKFLNKIGRDRVVSLQADYEQGTRLDDVIKETKTRLAELLSSDFDLRKALANFSDDKSVKIMTIHKSKGLEFEVVILLGVENEAYWGNQEEERCAFFVGVSRAKSKLVLTFCNQRATPSTNPRRWAVQRNAHSEFLAYTQKYI